MQKNYDPQIMWDYPQDCVNKPLFEQIDLPLFNLLI